MKAPVTPPRRRSLFVRGYDRTPLEGRIISKPKGGSRRTKALFVLAFVVVTAFSAFFVLGYDSAKRARQNGNSPVEQPPLPQAVLRANEEPVKVSEPILSEHSSVKRRKIAVAVTVTKDGPYLDGAAVLQHSIRMTRSKHDIEMVAIVHAGVQTTRPALTALGFRVLEFPPPIDSKEIQGKHLRETIDKSGCCGALELLKLCAWKLEQYDWVVSMDMDAIWLQNLDHLFDRDIPKGGFMFTYDFAMDNPGSKAPPVQGGFLIIRPSQATFDQLVGIVRIGDFRPNTGWGGANIGWCWGGQTVQGLLAYFAAVVEPSLSFPLDPCEYNSMATTKVCRRVDYSIVKTIHYTACQKPWECRQGDNEICGKFLHAWWMVRNDLETSEGLPQVGRCCHAKSPYCKERRYIDLNIDQMKILPMVDHNAAASSTGHIVKLPDDLPSREVAED